MTDVLEDVVPVERARVLRTLVRAGGPLSGRRITDLSVPVSQSTVSRLLVSMTESGLVDRVPGGYVINREHLAYPAVASLVDSDGELRRRIADLLTSWKRKPESVAIFGSVARGSQRVGSDIDLVVIRPVNVDPTNQRWADDVATLGERIVRWTGAPADILEYDRRELAVLIENDDSIVRTLRRDAITVAGTDVRELLRGAER